MIIISTYYIEKVDKPGTIRKILKAKIKNDNLEIYLNLSKDKNISKVIKKIKKSDISSVVLEKQLHENKNFINALYANDIKIFDGRWLIKYLSFEILDYIMDKIKIKKEETEIAITSNEITDLTIETIKILSKEYKRLSVITNHIDKLKKIEKEIYEKEGILIILTNNSKKSLLKPRIILNMDFNKELLNRYKINENAIIINLEGNMKIDNKRYNGININDYEIEVGKEEIIWRENKEKYCNKELLEKALYCKDSFKNIRNRISKAKVEIKELYGRTNNKI